MSQTLTQDQFIQVVSQTTPNTLNIWYTYDIPLEILGLTIPVVDNGGNNQETLLVQCTTVVFTVDNETFTLEVEDPVIFTTPSQIRFVFFRVVQPVFITTTVSPSTYQDTPVIFLPGLTSIVFLNSDSDVIINNILDSRKSAYIQESDRYKVNEGEFDFLAPLNIEQLRTDTAIKASVQDTNYEVSGWKDIRYEGVKSTRYNYSNVESAITGFEIQAALYPSGTLFSFIDQQRSGSNVIYSPYLSSTENISRIRRASTDTGYIVSSLPSATNTEFNLDFSASFTGTRQVPAVGDAISIAPQIPIIFPGQILPVITQVTLSTGTDLKIRTNIPIPGVNINNKLYILNITQIYRIDRNKVQPAQPGLIIIEGLDEIFTIDENGFVVASLTPVP